MARMGFRANEILLQTRNSRRYLSRSLFLMPCYRLCDENRVGRCITSLTWDSAYEVQRFTSCRDLKPSTSATHIDVQRCLAMFSSNLLTPCILLIVLASFRDIISHLDRLEQRSMVPLITLVSQPEASSVA